MAARSVEGGTHRHRVGVVAAVDDRYPVGQLHALPPAGAQRELDPALRGDANRPGRRHRGEQIGSQMGLTEGDLQLDQLALGVDHHPGVLLARAGAVAAVAEGDRAHVGAQMRIQQALADGDDRGRAGAQAGDQLGLGRGDVLDRPQQLEVNRPDADDHADVGLGDRRQLGDLAGAPHRHLEHEHLGAGGAARISSGSPISVLKLAREATVRRCGLRSASRRSLVEVLPVEPVTPITCAPSSRRHAVASAWSACSGSSAASTTPGPARAAAAACSGAVRDTPRPRRPALARRTRRRRCAGPGSPTNRVPGPASRESIVTRSGPAVRVGRMRARGAPAAAARPARGSSASSRASADAGARRMSRATVTSSNGSLRPRCELLPLLVALAGDHHDVAGPGGRDRRARSPAAIDLVLDPRVPGPDQDPRR